VPVRNSKAKILTRYGWRGVWQPASKEMCDAPSLL
jgi:hypothetical protein